MKITSAEKIGAGAFEVHGTGSDGTGVMVQLGEMGPRNAPYFFDDVATAIERISREAAMLQGTDRGFSALNVLHHLADFVD